MRVGRRLFTAFVLGACAALGPVRAAHAETTLERAKRQGYLRIGFANEAPFGYATPDGKLTGEAPEVARVILKKMGIPEVDGVLTEFGSLIPGLKAGRFDIIAAGMYVTPKRCEQIAFSEPSYGIGQAFLVKAGDPAGIRTFDDVARKPEARLGVMAGAVEKGYADQAGVKPDQLQSYPDGPSGVAAVRAGRVDAFALSSLSIQSLVKASGDAGLEATPSFGTVGGKNVKGHGAFAFRKEDAALLDAFDKELKAFIGTPEHLALVEPLGFGKDYLPEKTTAELCAGK